MIVGSHKSFYKVCRHFRNDQMGYTSPTNVQQLCRPHICQRAVWKIFIIGEPRIKTKIFGLYHFTLSGLNELPSSVINLEENTLCRVLMCNVYACSPSKVYNKAKWLQILLYTVYQPDIRSFVQISCVWYHSNRQSVCLCVLLYHFLNIQSSTS